MTNPFQRKHSSVAWLVAMVVVAAAAVAVSSQLFAQSESSVGYVSVQRLIDEYLVPALEGPMTEEFSRLQAEFDAEAAGLATDEERARLAEQYQARLDAYEQQLVGSQLPIMNAAVAAVAERHGLALVLDADAVIYGGVDLTDAVLAELAAGR